MTIRWNRRKWRPLQFSLWILFVSFSTHEHQLTWRGVEKARDHFVVFFVVFFLLGSSLSDMHLYLYYLHLIRHISPLILSYQYKYRPMQSSSSFPCGSTSTVHYPSSPLLRLYTLVIHFLQLQSFPFVDCVCAFSSRTCWRLLPLSLGSSHHRRREDNWWRLYWRSSTPSPSRFHHQVMCDYSSFPLLQSMPRRYAPHSSPLTPIHSLHGKNTIQDILPFLKYALTLRLLFC